MSSVFKSKYPQSQSESQIQLQLKADLRPRPPSPNSSSVRLGQITTMSNSPFNSQIFLVPRLSTLISQTGAEM